MIDVFAVQDQVTLEIVNALRVQLTPAEKTNISEFGTTNIEAHDLYLRGRQLTFSPNIIADIYQRVIDYCEQAIALDPMFARAYSGTAIISVQNFFDRFSGDDAEIIAEKLTKNAEKAFELAPGDPEVMQIYAPAFAVPWRCAPAFG